MSRDPHDWLEAVLPDGTGGAVVITADPTVAPLVAAAGWTLRIVPADSLGDPAMARASWRVGPAEVMVADRALTAFHHADKRAWVSLLTRELRPGGRLIVHETAAPPRAHGSTWRAIAAVVTARYAHRGPAPAEFWLQALRDAGLSGIETAPGEDDLVVTARRRSS